MASSSKSPYGGGGAGGKFRNKPFRRQATPYERPPAAIRNPIQAAKNVFVSKFVDPASKIIANSAHSLFSALFRKRLTAPPLVPEPTRGNRDAVQQAETPTTGSGVQERLDNQHVNGGSGLGNNEIKEIEEVLNQRTFTKAEIDHLMELLRSRTAAVPSDNNKNTPETTKPSLEAAQDFQESPAQGNLMESQRLLVGSSSGPGKSKVYESEVASAAELAKAYMDRVPLNVTPSNLGSHSQAYRKDLPLLTNAPYTPKSNGLSFPARFPAGVSDNGYTTPRSRGRSAIYNMARTPNSRVHDTFIQKVDNYDNNGLSSGRQALKRRSSILNSDIGSVGPIRRIRQKTNMMSPPKYTSLPTSRNSVSISGNADSSDIARSSRVVMQKQMYLDGPKGSTSNMQLAENDSNGAPNAFSVPSRSSEMAEKILQQIDRLVPSPKEKLSELKLAVAREKTPTKLTHNMLHGKALRSLENIDSSKLLKEDNLSGPNGTQLLEGQASTSHKKDETTPNASSNYKSSLRENGFDTNILKDNVPSSKASNSTLSNIAAHPTQKKRAFRMSAHEDFLDLDDDSDNGDVGLKVSKEKLDQAAGDTKVITVRAETSEKQSISSSENKSPTSSTVKGADEKVNVVSTNIEKECNFNFPLIPASGTNTQLTSPTPKASVFSNGAVPPKEIATSPTPSVGLKNNDVGGLFKLSSNTSAFNGSSDKTNGTQAEPKLTKSSTATVDVTATVTNTPKDSEPDEGNNTQRSKELVEHLQNIPSAASTSATTSPFLFGSSNKPLTNEGSFSVPSSFPVSSVQVSNGSSDVIFSTAIITSTTFAPTNTSSGTDTTISTTTTTTTDPPKSEATTAIAPSIFKSVSNTVTVPANSSSFPTSSTGIQCTSSEEKDKMTPSFGSVNGSPFGVSSSSSTFTTTGSSIFGFSASTASSTSNLFSSSNQSSNSNPFGTAVGTLFGGQGTSAETKTEAAPLTQSRPNQFGFSASSSPFGQSASSSVGSGSSVFGSSASNLFGSSSGFGLSSSTSLAAPSFSSGFGLSSSASVGTTSFSSSSGTSLFGTSSSTSPLFSSGFGSATSTSAFPFGGSSAPTASASMVYGSSLGGSSPAPVFPFSSAAASTSAPLPSPTSVFGTPSPFGSTLQSNDQVNMEDSMAEDTVQASNAVVPAFGQQVNSAPSANFGFGSGTPSGGSPFQFGGQQNLGTPQNQSPFQASGNLEFSAGSSFSLGTGGGDKANRRIVKVRRDKTGRKR